ncbi:MAG: hypothetical protein ACPGTP_00215 [Bacteroidia bacterium]
MKTRFSLLALLAHCGLIALGQSTSISEFLFLDNSFDMQWNPNSVKVESESLLGSNVLNTQMFSDVLFRTSFSGDSKQRFLDKSNKNTRFFGQTRSKAEYKYSNALGIYAKQNIMTGFNANKDFSELLFFGNAPFAGKKVETNQLRYIQSSSYTLGTSVRHLMSRKWNIKGEYGLSLVSSLREVTGSNLSAFTSFDGGELELGINSLSVSETHTGAAGMGIDVNLYFDYHLDCLNTFSVSVLDLNFNYLFDKNYVYLDSNIKFEGISYNFIEDTFALDDNIDSTYNSIIDNGRSRKKFVSLPSRLTINWNRYVNAKNQVDVSISTIDLGLYGTFASVGWKHLFSDKLGLQSSLGYGDFTGVVWKERAELVVNEKLNICLGTRNLHSLFVPSLVSSYGLDAGVALQF